MAQATQLATLVDLPYFMFAGPQLDAVVEKLTTITHANNELAAFHEGRLG